MDSEFKKALNGGIWALDAPDNKDPDASDVSPQLVRTDGFPSAYSTASGGAKPDRRRINQLFRELYGGIFELRMGVSPYDAEVDYPVNAITQVTGSLFRAVAANGPSSTVVSPTQVGQTTWESVTGAVTDPDPVQDFIFDNSTPEFISVQWKNGRDGGSRINSYKFQYRIYDPNGQTEWTSVPQTTIYYARRLIGPLSSGSQVQVRVIAITLSGDESAPAVSVPSPDQNSNDRVRGGVPKGGNLFALLASQSGQNARLTWTTPDNGGFPITQYVIQWRTENQQFSGNNQRTTTPTNTYDLSGLSANVKYYFQVAARNSEGLGAWSNIANLTIRDDTKGQPNMYAPTTTVTTSSFTANAHWANHATLPTATPISARWEWKGRYEDSTKWRHDTTQTGLTGFTIRGLTAGSQYQVRYKLTTSLGETNVYSPVKTLTTDSGSPTNNKPGAPTGVTGSVGVRSGPPSGQAVFVNWSGAEDNGFIITGWNVRWSWSGGSLGQSYNGQNVRSASTRIEAPPGTTVRVSVNARNNNGSGPSNSDTFTLT